MNGFISHGHGGHVKAREDENQDETLSYLLTIIACVVPLGFLGYSGYVLAERLGLPWPVSMATIGLAVFGVVLITVKGALDAGKLEEFLEERGYK